MKIEMQNNAEKMEKPKGGKKKTAAQSTEAALYWA